MDSELIKDGRVDINGYWVYYIECQVRGYRNRRVIELMSYSSGLQIPIGRRVSERKNGYPFTNIIYHQC